MSYDTCTTAANDGSGVFNIPQAHPSYDPALDANSDGLACETPVAGGTDLSGYQPSASTTASPAQLPVTGSAGPPLSLVLAGVLVLLLGVVALVWGSQSAYRRRH